MSDNLPLSGTDRNEIGRENDRLSSWLRLIGCGDKFAFKCLYDAVSPRLFGQAMKLMRSREAAEDVLQEAFLRIWASAGHYDPAYDHAHAWTARIIRNVSIDHLRRARKAQRYFVPDTDAPDVSVAPEPLEDRLDLERALSALPEAQKDAICSVVVEGWTHDEVASRSGVPLPTIKSRAQRGLKRLRSALDDEISDDAETMQSGMAAA